MKGRRGRNGAFETEASNDRWSVRSVGERGGFFF